MKRAWLLIMAYAIVSTSFSARVEAVTLPIHLNLDILRGFASTMAVCYVHTGIVTPGTPYVSNCSWQSVSCHISCYYIEGGRTAVACIYQYTTSTCQVGATQYNGCSSIGPTIGPRCEGLGAPFIQPGMPCSCD